MADKNKLEYPRILEHHIWNSYKMDIDEFSQYLANKYIKDKRQREIFLKKGVWTKVRFNYIGGLLITQQGKEIFKPKEIREILIDQILPSLSEIPDSQLSGMLLTQDVHLNPTDPKWHNGYPCLQKIDRGKYKFVGFL